MARVLNIYFWNHPEVDDSVGLYGFKTIWYENQERREACCILGYPDAVRKSNLKVPSVIREIVSGIAEIFGLTGSDLEKLYPDYQSLQKKTSLSAIDDYFQKTYWENYSRVFDKLSEHSDDFKELLNYLKALLDVKYKPRSDFEEFLKDFVMGMIIPILEKNGFFAKIMRKSSGYRTAAHGAGFDYKLAYERYVNVKGLAKTALFKVPYLVSPASYYASFLNYAYIANIFIPKFVDVPGLFLYAVKIGLYKLLVNKLFKPSVAGINFLNSYESCCNLEDFFAIEDTRWVSALSNMPMEEVENKSHFHISYTQSEGVFDLDIDSFILVHTYNSMKRKHPDNHDSLYYALDLSGFYSYLEIKSKEYVQFRKKCTLLDAASHNQEPIAPDPSKNLDEFRKINAPTLEIEDFLKAVVNASNEREKALNACSSDIFKRGRVYFKDNVNSNPFSSSQSLVKMAAMWLGNVNTFITKTKPKGFFSIDRRYDLLIMLQACISYINMDANKKLHATLPVEKLKDQDALSIVGLIFFLILEIFYSRPKTNRRDGLNEYLHICISLIYQVRKEKLDGIGARDFSKFPFFYALYGNNEDDSQSLLDFKKPNFSELFVPKSYVYLSFIQMNRNSTLSESYFMENFLAHVNAHKNSQEEIFKSIEESYAEAKRLKELKEEAARECEMMLHY